MAAPSSRRASTAVSRQASFHSLTSLLADAGRDFYTRGWVLGTSGNFSAVLSRHPLRLVVTSSGAHKGTLVPADFLETDGDAHVVRGEGKPSAELPLHLTLIRRHNAGAVLHTHSVWSTLLSEHYAHQGGILIAGYEMLKGLSGVTSHEHSEWLPILENSQDMSALAQRVEETLDGYPTSHGFLLQRHGLYTWGEDLGEARRHIEILEFLLEVVGRTAAPRAAGASGL